MKKSLRICVCALSALGMAFLASTPVLMADETGADVVVASSFGFDPQDATECLQKAIDSGAKTVVVDKQDSSWNVRPLKLRSNLELVLQEGVEIIAKQGEFRSKGECLMTAADVSNLTIRGEGKGACVKMRKKEYWEAPYDLSEWRHGISLLSSENITIENLTIAETGGDGIYVGVRGDNIPCRNVIIKNVDCAANNRQGISVISVDGLLIEDCVLRGTVGTPPMAGIDFEPNLAGEQISNVVMRRVLSIDNAGDGFAFYLPNMETQGQELSFTIESCQAVCNRGRGFGFHFGNGDNKILPGDMRVVDCDVVGNFGGIVVRGKPFDGAPLLFKNVNIKTLGVVKSLGWGDYSDYQFEVNPPETYEKMTPGSGSSRIALSSTDVDSHANGGISFENVEVVDAVAPESKAGCYFTVGDASDEGAGFRDITGSIVSTCLDANGTKSSVETTLNDDALIKLFPELVVRSVPAIDLDALGAQSCSELSKEIVDAWREHWRPNDAKKSGLKLRYGCRYYFYAEAGEKVDLEFQLFQVGKYELKPVELIISTPSKKDSTLCVATSQERKASTSYQVEETGWHKIAAEYNSGSMQLVSSSVPVFTATLPVAHAISSTGRFEFYVPKNASDLCVQTSAADSAERVTVSLFDPTGALVFCEENIETSFTWTPKLDAENNVETLVLKPGFWTIEFERPTIGVLEDVSIRIKGIPALIR